MPQHDIKFYNLLIANSNQGILNNIEYLKKDFKDLIFSKNVHLNSYSKKMTHCQRTFLGGRREAGGGGGGWRQMPSPASLLHRAWHMALDLK